MNTDLLERLSALGSHLDDERMAAATNEIAVTAFPAGRQRRHWRALVGVAAAVVLLVAVTVTVNRLRDNPDMATDNAMMPTLFDGGVDLIVWVYVDANPDQVALIRHTLESITGLLDISNIVYLDHDQTIAEARRTMAADPETLNLLIESEDHVGSMFKLYALPTTSELALAQLAEQLRSLPMVIETDLAEQSTHIPSADPETPLAPQPTIAAPETTAAG